MDGSIVVGGSAIQVLNGGPSIQELVNRIHDADCTKGALQHELVEFVIVYD